MPTRPLAPPRYPAHALRRPTPARHSARRRRPRPPASSTPAEISRRNSSIRMPASTVATSGRIRRRDREIADPADIGGAADGFAAQMQAPGRKRVAEQFAGDLGRDDDRDQHRRGEPEIAGRFQRDERHRQRTADHRRRQRAHADHRIDVRIEAETRPDQIDAGGEQAAAERAHEQRGEEQSAAKAGAERDDRGQRLQDEDAGDDLQRHRDDAGKMQRAMPRRHHLRRHQREQTDREAAERRAQRRPETGLRKPRLAQAPRRA